MRAGKSEYAGTSPARTWRLLLTSSRHYQAPIPAAYSENARLVSRSDGAHPMSARGGAAVRRHAQTKEYLIYFIRRLF